MRRMTRRNMRNIRCIVEEKTGVDLNPSHSRKQTRKGRMVLVLAAAVLALAMLGWGYRRFSPLEGDGLSLGGSYQGCGIVWVRVENHSEKPLEFQEKLKLMDWRTGQELPRLGGNVGFENTRFPPHSSGVMILDLSRAYDVEALEREDPPGQHYLLLTNQDFLFGQDWICSVRFSPGEPEPEETQPQSHLPAPVEPVIAEGIREELRFYFEDSYTAMTASDAQSEYLRRVQELLADFKGTVAKPAEPMLLVKGPGEGVVFDSAVPAQMQGLLVGQERVSVDAYQRIVGAALSDMGLDRSLQLMAMLPSFQGSVDGGVGLPLIHLFTYEVSDVQRENTFAFLYGRLVSFSELERCKVYQDERYAVYDVTDFFYTDLDAYIDDFLETRQDFWFDDGIRQRIHNIYDYYKDPEVLREALYYVLPPQQ